MQDGVFRSFEEEAFSFLQKLQKNNNKEWFLEHKTEYEKSLLIPLKHMVNDLQEFMLSIDDKFETRAVINKTISRIYRDTRFSRNKRPMKTNMWITFKRNNKNWKSLPAFYFEIQPYKYFYGMGFFRAEPSYMEKFRYHVDRNNQKFIDIISPIEKAKIFSLEGRAYKKIHTSHHSKIIAPWYSKKTFHLLHYNPKSSMDKYFITNLKKHFKSLVPLYHYLMEIDQITL